MALKTKVKCPWFPLILYGDFKGGQITVECFKGPNCKQIEVWISHWLSQRQCLIEAGLQPQSAILISIKRNNRVTEGKHCTTPPLWKPAGFIFKAVWRASFIRSKREKKAKERRAAGSVWEQGDYLYSTSLHYGSTNLDVVLLCVEGWLQPDCDSGSLKSTLSSRVHPHVNVCFHNTSNQVISFQNLELLYLTDSTELDT